MMTNCLKRKTSLVKKSEFKPGRKNAKLFTLFIYFLPPLSFFVLMKENEIIAMNQSITKRN